MTFKLQPEQAAVAVIVDGDKFLTIKRSQTVRAPGEFCFPGGGVENGETIEKALVREMEEELGIAVKPVREVWCSVSVTEVELNWWLVEMTAQQDLKPNPEEVESVHWFTQSQLLSEPKLLASNREFFQSLARGGICD